MTSIERILLYPEVRPRRYSPMDLTSTSNVTQDARYPAKRTLRMIGKCGDHEVWLRGDQGFVYATQ
jgi:hypothetical protein